MEGMLGGIVGLIGAGLQASNQAAQIEEEYAALNWQKQRAAQQDRFAQASRSDMYGNVTGYDPILNKWNINLTPDQTQIRDAGQKQQLLQLTQDMPAARKVRQAIQQRAYDAKEPYLKASLGYQYDQPQNEIATRSDLVNQMAVNDMMKSKADQALIMRSAMRMGGTGHPQEIIQAIDQQLGQNAQNRVLEARKQALAEYSTRMQQHEAKWGTPMKVWGDLMAQGGDIPNVPKSTMDQSLNSMINTQASGMNQAFQAGSTGVGTAMQALAAAMGKSPDLSAAASAFSKMKLGGTKKDDDTYDPTTNLMGTSTFGQSSVDDRSASGWD